MNYLNLQKSQGQNCQKKCFCDLFSSQQVPKQAQKSIKKSNKISLKKLASKKLKFGKNSKLQYPQSEFSPLETKVNSTFQHSKQLVYSDPKIEIPSYTRWSKIINNKSFKNKETHTLEYQNQIQNPPKRRHQRHYSDLTCVKQVKSDPEKSLRGVKKIKNNMNIFFSYRDSITFQSQNTAKSNRQSQKDLSQAENFSIQSLDFMNNSEPNKQIENNQIKQDIIHHKKLLSSAKLVSSEYSDSESQRVSQIIQMSQCYQNQLNSKESGQVYNRKQFKNCIEQFFQIRAIKN